MVRATVHMKNIDAPIVYDHVNNIEVLDEVSNIVTDAGVITQHGSESDAKS